MICDRCKGVGHVVRYIELQSEFENYEVMDAVARGGLTKEYLGLLTGKVVYQ